MYTSLGNNYFSNIYGDDRSVRVQVALNGTTILSGDDIISMEYESSAEGGSGMIIGTAISNKVTLKIYKSVFEQKKTSLIGQFLTVNVLINSYTVPMGQFYIDNADAEDGEFTTTLEMYDRMALATGLAHSFSPAIPVVGMLLQGIYQALPDKPATYENAFSSTVRTKYNTGTVNIFGGMEYRACRELVGYVAGFFGLNARYERTANTIHFIENNKYAKNPYGLGAEAIYQNGFRYAKSSIGIEGVAITGYESSVKNEYTYTAGSVVGNILSSKNPLITQAATDNIFALWQNEVLDNYEIHYRGNPAYDVGDRITVTDKDGVDHSVLITRHVIRVNGGMDGTIYCTYPSPEAQDSGNYSPISTAIEKKIPVISESYSANSRDGMSGIAVAEAINGIYVGGRNYLLESYGRPTGTSNGITRTYLGDCTYRLSGTTTATYDGAVYVLSDVEFEPGRYTVSFIGDVSNLKDVYVSVGTPSATETAVFNSTDKQKVTFDIPEGKVIRYVGVHVDSGVMIDTEIQLKMEKGNIQTDWTPAIEDAGPKFEVTTESITGINISGGTTTSATTFDITKEGYYPLGIVGEYWSTGNNTMYANVFNKYLSTQEDGSGVITYRIRNMASSSAITGTLVFKVLWIRIK